MNKLISIIVAIYSSLALASAPVGKVDGDYFVSEGGQFSYSIPFSSLAVGNGFYPSLSMHYSNSSSNGYLGLGWTLSGISKIHRCAPTQYEDGYKGGITLTNKDIYCLDGEKLVPISGSNGEDGSEYRLRRDKFHKIVSYGTRGNGPQSFRVWKASGEILDFGVTPDSIFLGGNETPLFYSISTMSDRNGNYVSFKYQNSDNQFYPKSIEYGGNEKTSLKHYRSFSFEYEGRLDQQTSYLAGTKSLKERRVSKIISKSHGRTVFEYVFGYLDSDQSKASKLESVTKCDSKQNCLKPTKFRWNDSIVSASKSKLETDKFALTQIDWKGQGKKKIVSDVNGDGFNDIVGFNGKGVYVQLNSELGLNPEVVKWSSNFATTSSRDPESWSSNLHPTLLQDVTGDGLPEVVSFMQNGIYVARNQGGEFETWENWLSGSNYSFGSIKWNIRYPRYLQDANGDSLADIIGFGPKGVYVSINTRSGFTEPRLWGEYGESISNWNSSHYARYVADVNADGFNDLLVMHNKGVYVAINEGGSFNFDSSPWLTDFGYSQGWTSGHLRTVTDINSDGILDIVGFNNTGLYAARGTGKSFEYDDQPLLKGYFVGRDWNLRSTVREFADINKDGILDIVGANFQGVHVSLGDGNKFSPPEIISKDFTGRDWNFSNDHFEINDIDGDGIEELIGISVFGIYSSSLNTAHPFINYIEDGFGNYIKIDYDSLTNNSIYQKLDTATYPVMDYQGAFSVVKNIRVGGPFSDPRSLQYKYKGHQIHRDGIGGLGFTEREIFDEINRIRTVNYYSHDYNKGIHGTKIREEVFHGDVLISEADFDWSTHKESDHIGLHVSLRLLSEVRTSYDIDGSVQSSTTETREYGLYGKPTKLIYSLSAEEGVSETQVENTYISNENSWIVGKLSNATATKTGLGLPKVIKKSSFEYDENGLLTGEILEPGTEFEQVKKLVRNSLGQIQEKSLGWSDVLADRLPFNSITSTISHDSHGFPIGSQNPLKHKSSTRFHEDFGAIESRTDPNGLTTTYRYDSLGNQVQTIYPDGTKVQVSRNWCDSSCPKEAIFYETVSSSGKPPKITYYDSFSRSIRVQTVLLDGKVVSSDQQYDQNGQLIKSSNPYFGDQPTDWTTIEYDSLGRRKKVTDPSGAIQEFFYSGNKKTIKNALGHETTIFLSSKDKPLKVVDSEDGESSYEYDLDGNMVRVIDPEGNITEFTYDTIGRKISIDDPSKGKVEFSYNGLGSIFSTKDNKGQTTNFTYDKLGRKVLSISGVGTPVENRNSWTYDSTRIGLLSSTSTDDFDESYTYDDFSRLIETKTTISGKNYSRKYSYDSVGRLNKFTYPNNFVIQSVYDANGYIKRLTDSKQSKIYWEAHEQDFFGNLTKFRYGNGAIETREYDQLTSLVKAISVETSDKKIQNNKYIFDAIGNLSYRENSLDRTWEEFSYDSLNRLTSAIDQNSKKTEVRYDSTGNIAYKSDVGSYSYGNDCSGTYRPFAVTKTSGIISNQFCYDANGNLVSDSKRSISYSTFNKPISIVSDGKKTEFKYDSNGRRFERSEYSGTNLTKITRYLGKYYEEVIEKGETTHKYYINDSVVVISKNGSQKEKYLHRDHIGSITKITDSKAKVIEEFNYDSWGKQKEVYLEEATSPMSDRGFTSHEHVKHAELIHMNGRVYDPTFGRFISPDPYVQDPFNSQSLNRYTYVWNNPLSMTDPSGYFGIKVGNPFKGVSTKSVTKTVKKTASKAGKWIDKNKRTIAAVAIVAVGTALSPFTAGSSAALAYSMALGYASGYVASGGDHKAAAMGALSAGMFWGVGTAFSANSSALTSTLGETGAGALKVAAHGTVGGINSVANGGKFEDGFRAAAVTQTLSQVGGFSVDKPQNWQDYTSNAAQAAVIGGVTAELTGGNFEDGALTAAYSRFFNDLSHDNLAKPRGPPAPTGKVRVWNDIDAASGAGHMAIEVMFDDGTSIIYEKFPDTSQQKLGGLYSEISEIRISDPLPTSQVRSNLDDTWRSFTTEVPDIGESLNYAHDPAREVESYMLVGASCLDYVRETLRAGNYDHALPGYTPNFSFHEWSFSDYGDRLMNLGR